MPSAISASPMISGGSSRTTLSPADDRDHLLGAQRVDQLGRRHDGTQADQQPFAAHFRDHARDSDP